MIPNCKEDTGWVMFDVEDSFTNLSWEPLAYRKIGNIVYIHGGGTLDISITRKIACLPENCLPRQVTQVPCMLNSSSSIANIKIDYDGTISYLTSTSTSQTLTIIINTSFIAR